MNAIAAGKDGASSEFPSMLESSIAGCSLNRPTIVTDSLR
jgi:hypothetical protein